MAVLTIPTVLFGGPLIVQGAVGLRYSRTVVTRPRILVPRDYRMANTTDGYIRDRVMLKTSPTAPEVPYTQSRVYVLRLADFYCAWAGLTDALGYYNATGLEPGVLYAAVAVDLTGEHKCTAGGPVVAVKA